MIDGLAGGGECRWRAEMISEPKAGDDHGSVRRLPNTRGETAWSVTSGLAAS
jgi:hypothetical protein